MVESMKRPRNVLFLLAVIAAAVGIKLAWPTEARAAASVAPNSNLVTTLHRVGLDPASLAAAGVTGNAAGGIVSALKSHFVSSPSTLAEADTAYASARVAHDQLDRKVAAGNVSGQDVVALQQAVANLASATTTRTNALNAAFTAATANLSEGQKTTLSTIQANRSWELALPYLAANRTQSEWVALRNALANKKISTKYGEAADPAATQLLQTVDATAAVSNAKANSETYLAAVTTAWNSAVQN